MSKKVTHYLVYFNNEKRRIPAPKRKDEYRLTIHLIQKSERHTPPSIWYLHIKTS